VSSAWWRDAVLYQIYPRSWVDSNGDGIGDLPGITQRLDHLAWLGIDGIWLNPIMPSPNEDWGYDVSDYCSVHPDLGTLDDLDDLVATAASLGLRVLLDLVPNHTSDRHAWFLDAASSRDARHRDCYVWADPAPDGGPPNNWLSVFGGEGAWEWHGPTGQYYLHNFLRSQPDLNWWNPDVLSAFQDILEFWYRRGIAGFRIDVAHALVKDRSLRDNPPSIETDHPEITKVGQRPVYNMNRPETHDILKRMRKVSDGFDPPRVLIGETYVFDVADLVRFFGEADELHLAFNFLFTFSAFASDEMKEIVATTLAAMPPEASPVWFGSNHDAGRFPSRWCAGDADLTRCALVALLMLPGATFLYYGDEIGMPNVELRAEDLRDPVGKRFWPDNAGRDPGRTPMQWAAGPGAGFTTTTATPWLPIGDVSVRNVEAQRDDTYSVLNLCRDLIALRREHSDLRIAPYVAANSPMWAWRRGAFLICVNTHPQERTIDATGTILVSTNRGRDGEPVDGRLSVRACEAVVVEFRGSGTDARGVRSAF